MGLLYRVGFLMGWICFGLAFLAAAAESAHGDRLITPLNDLLLASVPGKWIAIKAQYEQGFLGLLFIPAYFLPGWFLAGLPAGFLLWRCRPHREALDPELYNSLLIYDHLASEAAKDKALNDDPTFQDLRLQDDHEDLAPSDLDSSKDFLKAPPFDPDTDLKLPDEHGLHAPLKQAQGPEERMEEARTKMSIPFDKLS